MFPQKQQSGTGGSIGDRARSKHIAMDQQRYSHDTRDTQDLSRVVIAV
jgi:hypothetical protein